MINLNASGLSIKPAVYFPYSDGFRALAILTVFLEHLDIAGPSFAGRLGISAFVKPFDGVTMLFVLSAFLLSGPFLKAYFAEEHPFPTVGSYFMARLLRIYPLYFVAVIAVSGYEFWRHVSVSGWDVVSHIAFLQNLSVATVQTISGPFWTMAVDAQFYLFLPIVFWMLYVSTRKLPWIVRLKVLGAALAGIGVLSLVCRYVAVVAYRPTTLEEGIVYVRQLPGMLCVFVLGIAVRAVVQTASEDVGRAISRFSWGIIAFALVLEPISLALHLRHLHELAQSRFMLAGAIWSVEDALGALGCALLLLAVNFSPSNVLTRLLSTRVFAFAASISYGFYLFHLTVLQALVGNGSPSWSHFISTGSLALLILIPACFLLYHGIENPFLTIKSRLRRDGSAIVPDVSEMRHDRFEQAL